MLHSYLKTAFRHLRRAKSYTLINVLGLSVGIAACLFMLVFVRHELSFDEFHPASERLFRIGTVIERDGRTERASYVHAPVDAALDRLAGIENVTRIGSSRRFVLDSGGEKSYIRDFAVADGEVFDVFGYELERGDPASALEEPFSIVVTEELAKRITDAPDPMGQIVTLSGHDYTITGILAHIPSNTHWQFEGLRSLSTDRAVFGDMYDRLMANWNSLRHTYVRLEKGRSADDFEVELNRLLADLRPDNVDPSYTLVLQPVTEIHLGPRMSREIGITGSVAQLIAFSSIAVLILLIACINYTNLATARSMRRAREIGIRKTFGARRGQLVAQLLGESILLSTLAVVVAVGLLELTFPSVEALIGREIGLGTFDDPVVVVGLLALALLVGAAAGSYPAFFLASARPTSVFRGRTPSASFGAVRKGLVVVQFAVSIGLIAGTGIIRDQLDFIRTKDVGFSRDRVVSVSASSPQAFNEHYPTVREELLRIPGVERVTASMGRPGIDVPENTFDPDEAGTAESLEYRWLAIDFDFLETFDIGLVAGRDIDPERTSDATEAILVNESAVRALGLEDPVGHPLQLAMNDRSGTIVGVVEDFHVGPLREPMEPTLLYVTPRYFYSWVHLRLGGDDVADTMARIRELWLSFFPDQPFEYTFYDDAFEAQYSEERRLAHVAGHASMLAIFVACLGLFGLASYSARQRTREIGIRKVLGASISSVVRLLTRDFVMLVAVALFVAVPITWVLMDHWLAGFAYHTNPGIVTFAAAALIAGGIAVLTVGGQALRAALANPVDSLRTE